GDAAARVVEAAEVRRLGRGEVRAGPSQERLHGGDEALAQLGAGGVHDALPDEPGRPGRVRAEPAEEAGQDAFGGGAERGPGDVAGIRDTPEPGLAVRRVEPLLLQHLLDALPNRRVARAAQRLELE